MRVVNFSLRMASYLPLIRCSFRSESALASILLMLLTTHSRTTATGDDALIHEQKASTSR